MKIRFAWHVHHSDELLEKLWGNNPLRTRQEMIRVYKRKSEVGLRLRLMKEVRGPLPKRWLKAYAEYVKNGRSLLWGQPRPPQPTRAILALHRKECPKCPWNGQTIFPGRGPRL